MPFETDLLRYIRRPVLSRKPLEDDPFDHGREMLFDRRLDCVRPSWSDAQQIHRRVRGREKRSITLNTKLTRTEFAEVERYCESPIE